jgi:hypothetical protein
MGFLFEGFSWFRPLKTHRNRLRPRGGDDALVIALACRSLPPRQRKPGIPLGTGAGHFDSRPRP